MTVVNDLGAGLPAALSALASPDMPAGRNSEVPVSEHAIRAWCAALGEDNPIYRDEQAALDAGLDGIIAPPALLQTWTMPIGSQTAVASPTLHAQARRISHAHGFNAVVATDYEQEYLQLIHPGDRLTERSWIASVSDRKDTALGPGHFVTIAFEFHNQQQQLVGRMRARTLYFIPATKTPSTAPTHPPAVPNTQLRGLDIDLTRTLVIAGSLASNDHEAVHHDHIIARSQGLDDIIVSIVTSAGLIIRYVSSVTSPSTTINALKLRLAQPAYPGDVLALRGETTADGAGTLIRVTGTHARGTHVSATVAAGDLVS